MRHQYGRKSTHLIWNCTKEGNVHFPFMDGHYGICSTSGIKKMMMLAAGSA